MACGTPVITSHTSAMPEVAGEGAVLINPEQPQQIADALIKLENDADFYQKQVDYGLERVKLFSWRNTAEAYSKIYREIQKKQSLET
jgi:glycosyltransferase involved in cell wall biosynthesis